VAFVAFGAFVDDLRGVVSTCLLRSDGKGTYHGSHRFSGMGHFNATTAVGGIVPSLAGECGTVKACRQSVGGERASAALHVATVESRLARDGTASDEVLVGTLCRDGSSKSRAEQRKGWESSSEVHVDDACE
jgi:hypothetical protein